MADTKNQGASRTHLGIGAVARLTGLSTHTIRVWERRYGAVEAIRDERGRRLYTSADVERLSLLKAITERGRAIRRVANLGIDELKAELASLAGHARMTEALAQPRVMRLAVLGGFLTRRLDEADLAGLGLERIVAATDMAQFRADIRKQRPDVLLLELPSLAPDTRALLEELAALSGAGRILVVYGFGRQQDAERLLGIATPLRAPVTLEEIHAAIRAAVPVPRKEPEMPAEAEAPGFPVPGPETLPPRRYTPDQLARIAAIESAVDCECPRHLADLVHGLSDFEAYSQACESRNEEDAALHAYLHGVSARARALMEEALARVLAAEGLEHVV